MSLPPVKSNIIKLLARYLNTLYIRRWDAASIVVLICLYAAAEFGGVGVLAPIIEYLSHGQNVPQNGEFGGIWALLQRMADAIGVPVNLVSLLVLALIIILIRQLIYFAREYQAARIRQNAISRMRTEVIRRVFQADLGYFLSAGQGNILSAVMGQAARAGDTLLFVLKLLSAMVMILMYIGLLALIQPLLTLFSALMFLLVLLMSLPLVKRAKKYSREIALHNSRLMEESGDKIYGIRLLKMFSREKQETERLSALIRRLADVMTRTEVEGTKIIILNEPVILVAVVLIIYLGVAGLDLSITRLGLFLFVLYRLTPHVKNLNFLWQKVNSHSKSLDFMEDIIDRAERSTSILSGAEPFTGLREAIEFDAVSFSFDSESETCEVLQDLSFRIPRGSLTAVVGASGAGKSTLADLIPRLRDTTAGEIRLDGIPIRNFDLPSLRSRIGYLSQEPFLFNDTIASNIGYGSRNPVSEKDLESAAVQAHAHSFIAAMPEGYQTRIGDRGTRLSGGQKQRIVLARLILHDPDIIVLDEYTSALDSESEHHIQEVLNKIRVGKTMIVIAHRLATIKHADQILVLDRGRLAARGDFQTLIRSDALFKRLFEAQLFF